MEAGWWWLMIGLIIMILGMILYTGVFLVWLQRYGGARGLADHLRERLGRS